MKTIKPIWIYLNNYDFNITKISNVFLWFFSFSVSKHLRFDWNSNYEFPSEKRVYFYHIMFQLNSFVSIQALFIRTLTDSLSMKWVKIFCGWKWHISDAIVQFCHILLSWREIWIFISDVLHVTCVQNFHFILINWNE